MNQIRDLLRPKSVAVIGASPRVGALGNRVIANLHGGGYAGAVLPVHPRHDAVLRIHCHKSVADLPGVPDLAILCAPAAQVPEQFRQLGERGTRAVVVMASDPDGPFAGTPLKAALQEAAGRYGMRWFGPHSAGIQLPRLQLNASWIGFMPPAGKLALVTQSAAVAASALSWAAARGIGFSSVVTAGDGTDIDVPDLMDYLGADGYTQAVLLHLTHIPDGRKFIASARSLARQKPVVVLWSSVPATAAAEGPPAVDRNFVAQAAFHRSGLLRVGEIADWFDAVENLGYGRRQIGDRLAILCNGFGPAQLAQNFLEGRHPLAELGEAARAELDALLSGGAPAGNPLNLGVDAGAARYEAVIGALARSGDVDALLAIVAPAMPEAAVAIAQSIAHSAATSGLPVLACWLGGRVNDDIHAALAAAGVSLFEAPERAAQAYLHMLRFRRSQESLRELPEASAIQSAFARTDLRLSDEAESTDFLRACGAVSKAVFDNVPVIDGVQAGAVLMAVGFDAGPRGGAPEIRVPLRITAGNDPAFGRAIEASVGSLRRTLLPALNAELAAGAAADLHAELRRLDAPPFPVAAVARVLVRIADLLVSFPEVVGASIPGFDWDGVNLQPRQTRLWVSPYERGERHLAIRPYPREHEAKIVLRDGREALVRPLRPDEDVGLLEDLLAHVSSEDRLLRFCRAIEGIPPDVIARMARVDYDREMVFIALAAGTDGRPMPLGVVDAFVSPDLAEAEYSILLRSDLKGTGLGKALMEKVIAYCAGRGIRRLVGMVLRNNKGMRGLATRLGFSTTVDPEDDMVEVSLALGPAAP